MKIDIDYVFETIRWRQVKYFDMDVNSHVLIVGNDPYGYRVTRRYLVGDAPDWVRKEVLDYASQFSDTLGQEG